MQSSQGCNVACGHSSSVFALRVDPLDEPVEKADPDLVLADLILDTVVKVGVVVDLNDDDRAVGFLDVDAIETGADRARRPQRDVDDGAAARRRWESSSTRPPAPRSARA